EAGDLYERLVAILTLSLYALFTYIIGRHPTYLKFHSKYPHPLVRAIYIRDVMIQTAKGRREVNTEKLLELSLAYFDQFDLALEKLGLHQPPEVIEQVFSNIDQYQANIQMYASRFRRFTQKWTWVPLDEWS
ncbi:MAG: hypothetical protein AAFR59_16895, partial [Bacteroidota bacterium]